MNRVRVPRDNQAELLIVNTALFCFFFSSRVMNFAPI
jgi:hypothetical protein